MRLGARWRAGEPPHPSVPAELHEAIAAAERALPGEGSWTLTWLEGRPRCELVSEGPGAPPPGVLVTLDASGEVVVAPRVAGGAGSADGIVDDGEDDDDWLG